VVGAVGMELGTTAKGFLGQDVQKTSRGTNTVGKPLIQADAATLIKPGANASAAPTGTPPAAGSFSIFWITDTQFLSESNPALYKMMNNWIIENWAAYNGKIVIHTGDMVQTGNQEDEWANANDAMSVFLQNGIPYTWCAGNHDDLVQDIASSGWKGNVWGSPALDPVSVSKAVNEAYPLGIYTKGYQPLKADYAKWVGDYHNGMNTALSFTANGLNFLVINIEWNADPTVLNWASGILANPLYANYNVIMAPHAYIDPYGLLNDPRWGVTLASFVKGLTALMDANPNVFLTLNGHFATDSGYNTPAPVNGRSQLMFDRQDCCDYPNDQTGRAVDAATSTTVDADKVGGATVTILNFDTSNNLIHVSTYDVYAHLWRLEPPNQYSVPMFTNSTSNAPVTIVDNGPRIRAPQAT
jgi:hypothetical protein